MVEVSDKFKELAQENGRRVYCKIIADGVEFLDDKLIDMTFDDVVHPDWFTIGTACANRLHFTARYTGELSSRAQVTAFISFDNSEWCPLGVFYIVRRYVKGNVISVTAYDKLYELDDIFSYKGELPVTSDVLLQQICKENGMECAEAGASYKIEEIPADSTVRDMIGYIAGINRACAKMDRQGRLVLKKPKYADVYLLDKSCWGVQRNMSSSAVSCIRANTGNGELIAGSGADISTVEIYDPLMTQTILDIIYSEFKPFSFYGAELEMQGLPYLEAGDLVYFLDGKLLYTLALSEIEYTYDGGLSARLYSKNRTDEDDDSSDLENMLEKLLHLKNAVYYEYTNSEQMSITTKAEIIVDFEFETVEECFAQLDLSFTLRNSDADAVLLTVNVNGTDVPRNFIQSMQTGDIELMHVYHLVDKLPAGRNRVYVTAQTRSGTAYIAAGDMQGTLVGHGIYGNSGSQREKVTLYEKTAGVAVNESGIITLDISDSLTGGEE